MTMTKEEIIEWAKSPQTQEFVNMLINVRLGCLNSIASAFVEDKPEFKRQMSICLGMEYVIKNLGDLAGNTPHQSQFYPQS
jgi:hypothetical protein